MPGSSVVKQVADNNSAADIKTRDQKLYYALATIIVQILCLSGHIIQKFRFSASGRPSWIIKMDCRLRG